jgi:hypothetical protein
MRLPSPAASTIGNQVLACIALFRDTGTGIIAKRQDDWILLAFSN